MPTITDKFGKASIETNYALATTVKTARTIGESVLACYDLSRFSQSTPVFFVTYKKTTDPVTNEVTVTNQTSWKAIVNPDNNTLTNLTLAPGYVDIGNDIGDFVECIPTSFWGNELIEGIEVHANPDGTLKKTAIKASLGNDGNLVDSLADLLPNVAISGGVWSTLSGLNGAMTALTAYIDGYKNTVTAVATRAFSPSKDTYIDVLRNTSTNAFTLVYTEVANGGTPPELAANSYRLGIAVTNASALTSIKQDGSIDGTGEIVYRTPTSRNINVLNVDVMPNQPTTTSSAYQPVNGYSLPIKTSTGNILVTMNIPLSVSANNAQVAVLINGQYYDIINTSGSNGLGVSGSRILRGLPKNINLNPEMYFRIGGGATVAFLQFKHMSWSVEEV